MPAMRNLFEKRRNLKPYEYPHLLEYVDAIRHSYWLHTEFKYTSDVQDFHVNVTLYERGVIKRTMLAIAQIEVAVKTFWGDLYKKFPKPEVGSVGATFSESEVRHMDAYSHLLKILGLDNEFKKLDSYPEIKGRQDYLEKVIAKASKGNKEDDAKAVLLFSLFVEHVSLFSQFLIMMSFNKHRDQFKGISNAVEATSKEEQIHGLFGIELVNILRKENPELFKNEWKEEITKFCEATYKAEASIIEWIFDNKDLKFLTREEVKEFTKDRLNKSLRSVGIKKVFAVDNELLEKTEWFDNEVIATKHVDFFNKRSINYNKRSQSVTSKDLF